MNFREWLNINEIQVRNKPSSTAAVTDTSGTYGLGAKFGHTQTQLPFSRGYDNKAVAGLAAGIGSGTSKAMADTGYEASPTPQIEKLPNLNKPHTEYGYLPLQLPVIYPNNWLPGLEPKSMISYESDISKQVYKYVQDPDNDPKVRRPNDDPKNTKKFATMQMMRNSGDHFLGHAKNFTRALIKISIIERMKNKGLDKKYDLIKGTLGKEYEENGNLVCVFYFETYKALDQKEVD